MARPRRDWLPALGEAAFAAFVAEGYRRTQVQDVADRMKVSVGTIYKQVESKEALFELAACWALGLSAPDSDLPLRSRPLPKLVDMITSHMESRFVWPVLKAAPRKNGSAVAPTEFAGILREMFDGCSRERRFLRLLDSCAQDIPALADAYVNAIKAPYLADLTDYLRRRQRAGAIRARGGCDATARAMVEAVVWMASCRHFDSLPPVIDDADAREAVIAMVMQGVCDGRPAKARKVAPAIAAD